MAAVTTVTTEWLHSHPMRWDALTRVYFQTEATYAAQLVLLTNSERKYMAEVGTAKPTYVGSNSSPDGRRAGDLCCDPASWDDALETTADGCLPVRRSPCSRHWPPAEGDSSRRTDATQAPAYSAAEAVQLSVRYDTMRWTPIQP